MNDEATLRTLIGRKTIELGASVPSYTGGLKMVGELIAAYEELVALLKEPKPAPVVGEPPIISPSEEQLPRALSLLAGEIADLRDSERALRTELYRLLQDNPSAIYDANYSASIPSTETPEEEQTHERDDEPLRMHEVRPAVRPSSEREDGPTGESLLPGAGQGGVQQEPVAEADVQATPTMTPEESMIWEAEQAAIPVVLKQAKPSRSAGWTSEMRAAAGERSRNRRRAAPFGLTVKTEHLTKEPENAAILDTPLAPEEEPETTLTHFPGNGITAAPTPEEAAHEDAAIILAARDFSQKTEANILPDCTCPEGWWDVPRGSGAARIPSSKHDAACPLHRHRWRLPSASSDGEGGKYTGVCECGETKLHEPFGVEDNRAAAKKEQQVKAGLVGAAARTANQHTAAVSA